MFCALPMELLFIALAHAETYCAVPFIAEKMGDRLIRLGAMQINSSGGAMERVRPSYLSGNNRHRQLLADAMMIFIRKRDGNGDVVDCPK